MKTALFTLISVCLCASAANVSQGNGGTDINQPKIKPNGDAKVLVQQLCNSEGAGLTELRSMIKQEFQTMKKELIEEIEKKDSKVPDPIAFFPLNGAYGTKEKNNKAMQGNPKGVTLSQGPDGKNAGSYEFSGTSNSFIEFPNSDGGPLDVNGGSMTMLCWIYPTGKTGPLFNYKTSGAWGVHLWDGGNNKLFVRFTRRDYSFTNGLAGGSLPRKTWHLVGASYDVSNGLAKLWVNALVVRTLNIGAGINLATQDNVSMGVKIGDGRYYKGKIAQMQVYNDALSAKQIQEIKQRTPVA